MEIYLKPILSACYIFPILAVIFTLPYILYEYHKYGSLLVIRTGIVYTFIFYMLTSYFMTILPLPSLDSVTPDSASMLLVPFDAVRRTIDNSGVIFAEPATYVNIFTCSDFWQIIFNILLLLPFGVYLRYYFKRPWWQVLIFSFLYSLFFELTQLSGLYGIYKYPYRFFEVDDLICNTLGGMVGYAITPLLVFMLPDRDRIDEIAYKKGQVVSEFRRGIAWCIDIFLIMLPAVIYVIYNHKDISVFLYDVRYTVMVSVYIAVVFIAVTSVCKGRTIGKALVNIRVVRVENVDKKDEKNIKKISDSPEAIDYKRAGILRLAVRYITLYVISMPSLAYAYYIYDYMINADVNYGEWKFYVCIAGIIVCVFIAVYMALDLLLCLFSHTRNMLYDRMVKLTHINMSGRDYKSNTNIETNEVVNGSISQEKHNN